MNENKFTPTAEEALRLAQEAAGELGHGYVGTEHLLLGILREGDGVAVRVLSGTGVPKCDCGGVVKPDVVLYEEQLDSDVIEGAVNDIRKADLLIVGGTSLAVYPAAGLINYYRGSRLVLINKSETPRDREADLVLHGPIGQILDQIKVKPL